MIHFHLSYDFNLVLPHDGRIITNRVILRHPDIEIHPSTHYQLVDELMAIEISGNELHIITWSGALFWAIVYRVISEKRSRKEIVIHHHTGMVHEGNPVVNKSYLSSCLDLSIAIPNDLLVGGSIERSKVYELIGRYKGDFLPNIP